MKSIQTMLIAIIGSVAATSLNELNAELSGNTTAPVTATVQANFALDKYTLTLICCGLIQFLFCLFIANHTRTKL